MDTSQGFEKTSLEQEIYHLCVMAGKEVEDLRHNASACGNINSAQWIHIEAIDCTLSEIEATLEKVWQSRLDAAGKDQREEDAATQEEAFTQGSANWTPEEEAKFGWRYGEWE
jgi:hypothetical protein